MLAGTSVDEDAHPTGSGVSAGTSVEEGAHPTGSGVSAGTAAEEDAHPTGSGLSAEQRKARKVKMVELSCSKISKTRSTSSSSDLEM